MWKGLCICVFSVRSGIGFLLTNIKKRIEIKNHSENKKRKGKPTKKEKLQILPKYCEFTLFQGQIVSQLQFFKLQNLICVCVCTCVCLVSLFWTDIIQKKACALNYITLKETAVANILETNIQVFMLPSPCGTIQTSTK